MKPKISVILNVYKRGAVFPEQIRAIREQSIMPIEILVWENGNDSVPDEFGTLLLKGFKFSWITAPLKFSGPPTGALCFL